MSTVTDMESYQQFALEQQAQNNAWSAEQAQKQMDFQKMMSDTSHQREVADLKAAGLNPVLAANSGAQVTQGASAEADKSAAGNVGQILQQVLQAQSAREVAAMYNSATIYAAQIAAQASMYGADMSYWNTEDHPHSAEEVMARGLLNDPAINAVASGNHQPNRGPAGASTDTGTRRTGADNHAKSTLGKTKKSTLDKFMSGFSDLYNKKWSNMDYSQRAAYKNWIRNVGKKDNYGSLLAWYAQGRPGWGRINHASSSRTTPKPGSSRGSTK